MGCRISITMGAKQKAHLSNRSERLGMCPTAYVAYLVNRDIELALNTGEIASDVDSFVKLSSFIKSLVSNSGVDVDIVNDVCDILEIDKQLMRNALSGDDEISTAQNSVEA